MKKLHHFVSAMLERQLVRSLFDRRNTSSRKNYASVLLLATFLSLVCPSSSRHVALSQVPNVKSENSTSATGDNNKSFFPFGFYHVSWQSTLEERLNALRTIAASGFNTIHASIKGSEDFIEYGKFLDEADRLGVRVISEFNREDKTPAVERFKDKPAVLGWSIADDAGIEGNLSCDRILSLHNRIKEIAPQHLTYISVALVKEYKNFNRCSDLIGAQDYPVPKETTNVQLYEPAYVMEHATREAAKYNRTVYANLQAFAWEGSRAPSFKEVRNMTYQAFVKGVKGVLYYSFHDPTWDLPNNTRLWNGMKTLTPEVKQLAPIFLNGELTKIATGSDDLYAGVWKYQDRGIAIVINTSYTNTENVSIQLPFQKIISSSPTFAKRPAGMSVQSKILSGTIKPLDVHVYSFKL